MKNRKIFSVISLFLSILMLLGALPMGAVAFEAKAADYRGAMSEDENGVMVYDALREYLFGSKKNQVLLADYEVQTQDPASTNTKKSVGTVDTRYPDPVVDLSIYYDPSVYGTTPVIRQGLSELEHVTYVDSKTGEISYGEAPKALTGSNGGDATYNGGYGVNENGETTTHYDYKNFIFYLINHNCSERIGTESDVSILSDYIAEGYVVVVVDYKNQASAVTPYIEMSLVYLYDLFKKDSPLLDGLVYEDGSAVKISVYGEDYFLPEGCRLARDIWYYDPSIFAANGVMEKFVEVWNANIANKSQDTHGIGTVSSVEDLIERAKQKNYDLPIDYKLSLSIIYPSQPKDGYEAPMYIQEGTNQVREQASNAQDYRHGTLAGFALNGYAAAVYDHPFYPFLMRFQYDATFGYGNHYDNYNNARAAVRCVRYYADEFGYSGENMGIAGISKATIGTAMLATKNNKELQCTISGYNTKVSFGDIFPEGTAAKDKTPDNRLKEILQPFAVYADGSEVSSDLACAYVAAGSGVTNFFSTGQYTNREMIPMVVSDGVRDEYNSYDYYESHEAYYEDVVDTPYLMIPMMDQDHTYPVGYDDEYGYERFSAMVSFFDVYLKPDENRAPEVLWITPTDGSTDIPVSGEWTVGPYTMYGMELNGYEREQKIRVRFVEEVSPESVGYGMVVRDANGKRIGGEWVASQNDTMYTFVTDGLKAGTTYTITATSGIVSKNGTPLTEEKSVTFTTEGSYALFAVADTYVSELAPDTAFGESDELLIEGGAIALLSYPAASVAGASSITLNTYGLPDAGFSASIYAITDYLVDEEELTYNLLTGSAVWANKLPLCEVQGLASEQIAIDLSALGEIGELGDYVTLVIVSKDAAVEDPYVYENDFEGYTLGTAQTGVNSAGTAVTVLAAGGAITDGRAELDNRIYSDYIARLGGANPQNMALVSIDGTQALRVYGISESVKLYNSFKTSALTEEDVGKSFRIRFRAKCEKNGALYVTINSANAGEGGSDKFGTFTGPASTYSSTSSVAIPRDDIKAGEWMEYTAFVTVTEEMVATQSGLLAINFPWATWHFYAWVDDVVVEECTPRMLLASKESDSNLRPALITVNAAAVDFATGDLEEDEAWVNETMPGVTAVSPAKNASDVGLLEAIALAFDKPMDILSFDEGLVVVNETTGETVKGEWTALDEDGKSFAFTTKGFMAGCTYSVTLTEGAKTLLGFGGLEEVITRFTTEGSSAVRPLASTYVSAAEPDKNFGLAIDPVIDADKLGVLTYSAKALAGASGAKLYLPISTEASASLEVYAIADYMPTEDFSYNALSALALTKLADVKAGEGILAVDAEDILALGAKETVTFVLKATYYVYDEDFDSYELGVKSYLTADGKYAAVGSSGTAFNGRWLVRNMGFYDLLFCNLGNCSEGKVISDSNIADSQCFAVLHYGGQTTKFYRTLKDYYLTAEDIGKTYSVSFKILVPESTLSVTYGTMCEHNSLAEIGGEVPPSASTGYSNNFAAEVPVGEWTTITNTFTVTELMVSYQASMLGINTNVGTANGNQYVYYDDIKLVEIVPTVTVDKDTALMVTAHEKVMTAPIATTYASSAEPTAHYGLNVSPKVDVENVGVLTYDASVLNGATEATLKLPVSVDSEAKISIYAIADHTPDESFCYNTLEGLSLTKITDAQVENGTAEIDVKALAALGATESVTLVLKVAEAFTFEQNFDSYEIGKTYLTSDGRFAVVNASGVVINGRNSGPDYATNTPVSEMIWRNDGTCVDGWLVNDESLADSQIFAVMNYYGQTTRFYSVLTDRYFTEADIGRVFEVSYRIWTPEHVAAAERSVRGSTDSTAFSKKTLTLNKGGWTTDSFTVEITAEMVEKQAGTLAIFVNSGKNESHEKGYSTLYFDDIKTVEILPAVEIGAEAILMTEGSKITIALPDSEKPVKDNELNAPVLPDVPAEPLPNLDASIISYQVTKGEEGAFALRLVVGLDSLVYKNVGYEITVTDAEGARTRSGVDTRVYTSICGGETVYSIKETFGYEYASLATLIGLALDSNSTEIVIRSYVTTNDGETLYGRGATLLYTGMLDSEGYPEVSVVIDE